MRENTVCNTIVGTGASARLLCANRADSRRAALQDGGGR